LLYKKIFLPSYAIKGLKESEKHCKSVYSLKFD